MSPTREQEFDGPWKQALEVGFDLFLGFFLPDLHEIINWTKNHDSLDQELSKLTPESSLGVRRVDKLIKAVRKRTGDPRFFHVEAQAQPQAEQEFAERMYVYNYRGRDLLGQPIISIAILSDDDLEWHPKQHHEGELGSELTFTFRTVKVLKWAERQAELEASDNLFALFASAHLEALKTRKDPDQRAEGKRRLLTNLANREQADVDKGKWWNLIDWILPLPPDQEQRVWDLVRSLKEGDTMTFVPFYAREAHEQGLAQGIEQGIVKGIEQGKELGSRETSRQTLRAFLKRKFGEEGEALVALLPEQTPLARLEELIIQVGFTTDLETLRPLFSQP